MPSCLPSYSSGVKVEEQECRSSSEIPASFDVASISALPPEGVYRLLALKAAADFSVDLRNHDPRRTWDVGFVDN